MDAPDARGLLDLLRVPRVAAGIVALAAFAWGAMTVSHYGVTFDSPSLFYAGDRTLFFLTHPNTPFALDFMAQVEPAGFHSNFVLSPEITDPVRLPSFPGLVCAITDAIFRGWLGWTSFIDGHHLGLVLMHAVALFAYVTYGSRLIGLRAAVLAGVMLALFPCALGHSFNNAKDWPSAQFYGVTVLAAAVAILEERPRALMGAGVWLGVALAAKLNPVFAVVTVLLWLPLVYRVTYWRARPVPDAMILASAAFPLIGAATFFLSWPWLYHGPIRDWPLNLLEYFVYMFGHGSTDAQTGTTYPLRCVVFMTPPIVLALAALYALRGSGESPRNKAIWALLLLWTALPVVRVSVPGAAFYDANRHYIEYIPGLCAMAGAGASWALDSLARSRLSHVRAVHSLAIATLIAGLVWPIAETHPFETTYYNVLASGLGGAQRAGLLHADPPLVRASGDEGDYWYNSLRDALGTIRPLRRPGQTLGACGPWEAQVRANWDYEEPLAYVGSPRGHIEAPTLSADFLYVSPREGACDWQRIRELERTRPVLWRVMRQGGLVYEVLGLPDGSRRPAVSFETLYDPSPAETPAPPAELGRRA